MVSLSVVVLFTLNLAAATPRTGPSAEFNRFQAVNVELYRRGNAAVRLASAQGTGNHSRHHMENLRLVIKDGQGADQVFELHLQLNHQLLPDSYFEKKQHKIKGKYITKTYESRHHIELCHYQGIVTDRSNSWAAISTCNGIHGVIYDGLDIYHLETTPNGTQYLYKGSDHHSFLLNNPTNSSYSRIKRSVSNDKNQAPSKTSSSSVIKGPWNANTRSRYVELLLVVDNREYLQHDSDLEKIHRICKDVANLMNALYSPLNIYIALVGVVVWTEYDEIALSSNADTTLTNFLHYRKERLVKDHPNDNAQLLTGIQFDKGVVGKALKGPMCTLKFSGGVNMWHSDIVGLVATTIAHEMGHNFGMEHDTEDCDCPDDRCIMAPASSTLKPTFWSSCSLEYLALAFEHGMDYCLRNKPKVLFLSPVCGNGFLEEGEECDCGLKNHCDNPCCNPDTCKLYPNATCATGECCDFSTCQPKQPGAMCRRASHDCDLPEFCSGKSEFCPTDVYKVDGTSCKVGKAYCYQGSCRTHSDQCKLLWGPSGKKSNNQCYEQNSDGSRHGNCGYNRLNESFIKCPDEDVRCGMLHCSHLNERLEFGMESVAILSHSFINAGGTIIPCRTALVDLGLGDIDPGLAPEGASCGEDKLCVDQKCMPVAALRIGPNSCPNHCGGRGICNSLGHCHCDNGYSGVDCMSPGPGGSVDSGPASSPETISPIRVFIFVCLALVPLLLLFLLILFLRSRGDNLRTLIERAKQGPRDTKKSRHDLEISAPLDNGMSNAGSAASSPTHALLPRGDSTSTGITTTSKDSDVESSPNIEVRNGKSKSGLLLFTRKQSVSDESGQKTDKGTSFMQNLARSITFPSAIKSREGNVKYEIKVEPKSESASTPSGTTPDKDFPADGDDNCVQQQEQPQLFKPTAPPRPAASSLLKHTSLKKSSSVPEPDVNNPKLAFPHSSSLTTSGDIKSPFLPSSTSPLAKPLSPVKTELPPPSYIEAITQASTKTAPITSPLTDSDKPVQSPFFKKSTTSSANPTSATMSKTSTLPTALSSLSGDGKLSKSSTLPNQPHRLQISKPVLQTATPTAANLISKAPSTGVSQSSILSKTEKSEKRDRSSRGVVFCDPLTLPSPTNPNNPPIIHQQNSVSSPDKNKITSPTKATAATIVTPQWKSGPLTSDVVLCHIDDTEGAKETSPLPPIASPDLDSELEAEINLGQDSKTGARSSFRNLKISSPVLQSTVDIKTKLIPVCNPSSMSSTTTTPPTCSSPVPKRTAPPPPIVPRGQLKSASSPQKPESKAANLPKQSSLEETGSKRVPWRFGRSSSSFKSDNKRESVPSSSPDSATKPDVKKTSIQHSASLSGKRPASIATTRPTRPSAPPPKPPPQEKPNAIRKEPIYDVIKESQSPEKEILLKSSAKPKPDVPSKPELAPKPERPSSIGLADDLTSPIEEFVTPTSSPLFARKSPDTLSTASSTDGDLMKEILKEMVVGKDENEEKEIYGTLSRKKKKDKK